MSLGYMSKLEHLEEIDVFTENNQTSQSSLLRSVCTQITGMWAKSSTNGTSVDTVTSKKIMIILSTLMVKMLNVFQKALLSTGLQYKHTRQYYSILQFRI